jgi:hypothetical protein
LNRLSKKTELSEQAIYDSKLFKELQSQFDQLVKDKEKSSSAAKHYQHEYETLRFEKKTFALTEARHLIENTRMKGDLEQVTSKNHDLSTQI